MRWGNWGPERLSNLSQVTQLLSDKARTRIQVLCTYQGYGLFTLGDLKGHGEPSTTICWKKCQSGWQCSLGWPERFSNAGGFLCGPIARVFTHEPWLPCLQPKLSDGGSPALLHLPQQPLHPVLPPCPISANSWTGSQHSVHSQLSLTQGPRTPSSLLS